MKRYLILLFIFATVTNLNAQSQKKKDRIEQLNAQLTAFDEAKDWINARKSLKELYSLDKPNKAHYYCGFGVIAEQEGKIDEAIKIYQQAISRYKKSDCGYFNLGRIYYNKAIEIQGEADKRYYDRYDERYIAEKEKAKQYFRQALPLLEKGVEISPKLNYLIALRSIYYNLEMVDKYNEIDSFIEKERNKK